MNLREKIFKLKYLKGVVNTKFNFEGAGYVRICLVPAKFSLRSKSSIVILDSKHIVPIAPAWTVLLENFLYQVSKYYNEITNYELEKIKERAVNETKKVYTTVSKKLLMDDLTKIIDVFIDIAKNNRSNEDIGQMDLAKYSKYMKGPIKVTLMLTPFSAISSRVCNSSCIYYQKKYRSIPEYEKISVEKYKKIINILKNNNVAEIVFDGNNILSRKEELLELLEYTKNDFATSLTTKGARIDDELCEKMAENGLDEITITLYSANKKIHNLLSNEDNFDKVVNGIKSAVKNKISVVVDTPICNINSDYLETLKFIKSLGVNYVSIRVFNIFRCLTKTKEMENLTKGEMLNLIEKVKDYLNEEKIEMKFETHCFLPKEKLKELGIIFDECRACVNELTINYDGKVVPCKDCVNAKRILGNIFKDSWSSIWNSSITKNIRNEALSEKVICPLNKV